MAAWTFALGDPAPSTRVYRELTSTTGRRITWRLDAPADAQFSLDGRHDEASELDDYQTDLHVFRDGARLYRGRIGPSSEDIDPTGHRCQFTAIDYRGMLNRRLIAGTGETFDDDDQGLIAWQLIATSQAQPGGNWGITNGVGATSGQLRDRTYDPGKPRGEAITELGRVDNGFEWEISPTLALNRWYPQRGANNNVVVDWGGLLSNVSRPFDPGDYANTVIVTGAEGLTPVTLSTAGVATDPRGRIEAFYGFPSILEQTTLNARAVFLLEQVSTIRPSVVATFTQGRWGGPGHVWLGDTVRLVVPSGRLRVNELHRVVELAVQLDDNGGETVQVGLQAGAGTGVAPTSPSDAFVRSLSRQLLRIADLERAIRR